MTRAITEQELRPRLEKLREFIKYDSKTGCLYWIKAKSRNIKPGIEIKKKDTKGRIVLEFDGFNLMGHHVAWAIHHGKWPRRQIDHINHSRDDNRINNLREATNSQNSKNRTLSKRNNTGYKGVTYHKNQKKYNARIMVNGIMKNLGSFTNPIIAAHEYNKAAIKYHGEYASLNPVGGYYE